MMMMMPFLMLSPIDSDKGLPQSPFVHFVVFLEPRGSPPRWLDSDLKVLMPLILDSVLIEPKGSP